jgi:hypothetical protein
MKHVLKYFIAPLLLLGILSVSAQEDKDPIVISSRTSSTEILLGDQFTYELLVEYDKEYKVLQVEPPLELGKFEIQEVNPPAKEEKRGDRLFKSFSFTLSTYETGDFEVPAFSVTYMTPSGAEKKAQTEPIKIKVKEILKTAEDTHDVRDIKRPLDILPKPYLRNLLIGILGAILIPGAIVYLVRRRILAKRKQEPEEWIPPRPIEELALEELDALERSPLLAEGKIKEYYSRLSEIVRIYLGRRFHINIIDMTSYETLRALEDKDIQEGMLKLMEGFFDISDLVKFAKYRPQDTEHGRIMEQARLVVRETTPKPVIEIPESGIKNDTDTSSEQEKEKPALVQADKGGMET